MAGSMIPLPDLPLLHRRFLTISRIAREKFDGHLAGRLLLRAHLDPEGLAEVLAAAIAGAASLCVDADAGRLREALRSGLCDFVVGQMNESLRILKNEIRRGRAVSVGLGADEVAVAAELLDRGVQPDLIAPSEGSLAAHIAVFVERGAVLLPRDSAPDPERCLMSWRISCPPGRLMPQIAAAASAVLDESSADTPARRRWLEVAPRTLGRAFAGRQCLQVTEAEADILTARLRAGFPAVVVEVDGRPAGL